MVERDDDHFDIDDDFVAESDEEQGLREVHRFGRPTSPPQRQRRGEKRQSRLEQTRGCAG